MRELKLLPLGSRETKCNRLITRERPRNVLMSSRLALGRNGGVLTRQELDSGPTHNSIPDLERASPDKAISQIKQSAPSVTDEQTVMNTFVCAYK